MQVISVNTRVKGLLEEIWKCWTDPQHIVHWYFASPDWHCPDAKSDLKPGGSFSFRMEAKDGSMGFDYTGVYTKITPMLEIVSKLSDGRKVEIKFEQESDLIAIYENFEVEDMNSIELQRQGWQAILDNFKAYAESRESGTVN